MKGLTAADDGILRVNGGKCLSITCEQREMTPVSPTAVLKMFSLLNRNIKRKVHSKCEMIQSNLTVCRYPVSF